MRMLPNMTGSHDERLADARFQVRVWRRSTLRASIERTSSGRLRLPPAPAHVQRLRLCKKVAAKMTDALREIRPRRTAYKRRSEVGEGVKDPQKARSAPSAGLFAQSR